LTNVAVVEVQHGIIKRSLNGTYNAKFLAWEATFKMTPQINFIEHDKKGLNNLAVKSNMMQFAQVSRKQNVLTLPSCGTAVR
jgi:hypothetical protein